MKPITEYSDKELLELTADAVIHSSWKGNQAFKSGFLSSWNPLTDAGDRARMCDELQLDMLHCKSTGEITVSSSKPTKWHRERYSDHNNSRTTAANYAAVRLVAKMELQKREDGK